MIKFKKSSFCNSCYDCNQRSPLFSLLSEAELIDFNKDRFEATYRKGEMIFKQGAASAHILMLTNGLAKIFLEGNAGRGLILKLIKPTEMFGGPGIFLDGRNYYSATALEDCSVCFITHQSFKNAIRSNPEFTEKFIEIINRNAVFNFGRFVDVTQKQMPGRIADALLYLSKEIYKSDNFTLSLTRQDLADMTNLSKESVIRILKDFRENGVVVINSNNVKITKMETLEQISLFG